MPARAVVLICQRGRPNQVINSASHYLTVSGSTGERAAFYPYSLVGVTVCEKKRIQSRRAIIVPNVRHPAAPLSISVDALFLAP